MIKFLNMSIDTEHSKSQTHLLGKMICMSIFVCLLLILSLWVNIELIQLLHMDMYIYILKNQVKFHIMMKQLQLYSAFNWWNKHDFAYKLSIFLTHLGHYLNQCWNIVNWTLRNKLQWKFNRNSNIFIHENAIERVVCKIAAILSRPQCVNLVQCQPHKWRKCTVAKSSSCQAKWCLMYSLCQCLSFYGCCLTHWGQDKIAAVSQTTFSNAFSWMKMVEFRLKFHWNLFLRVLWTIFQHWFR